jgi:hypothetical protein
MSGTRLRARRVATAVLAIAALVAGLTFWLSSTDGDVNSVEASTPGLGGSHPAESHPTACSKVVSSIAAMQSAVSAASSGTAVCLADGSYGKLTLGSSAGAPGVTARAEHPGQTTIAGADLNGSNLTLARFDITDEVSIEPGSIGIALSHNRITGGYFGVDAGPTSSTPISDTTIRGNKFVGPFGEDALRLNRYHDGPDANHYGILIEGNEFTNIRENGNHSDCLQTVWVGDHLTFRRNYLHDNRCQGFFVKDQASPIDGITVNDNLFVRDSAPCSPPSLDCGQPAYFQVFGPYAGFTMIHNTIWDGDVLTAFQDGAGPDTVIDSNVINRFWTDTNLSGIAYRDNTRCKREAAPGGSWPSRVPGETVRCSPPFADPAVDDYRLGNGRGVNWAPAAQHYGP